jgi:Protein-L-isoaspartate(D-aspartate) O-methyltransferase (PCMT)
MHHVTRNCQWVATTTCLPACSKKVAKAFQVCSRDVFVPEEQRADAFLDHPVPLDHDFNISAPRACPFSPLASMRAVLCGDVPRQRTSCCLVHISPLQAAWRACMVHCLMSHVLLDLCTLTRRAACADMHACMIEGLKVEEGDEVLDVGSGCGVTSALLACLVRIFAVAFACCGA